MSDLSSLQVLREHEQRRRDEAQSRLRQAQARLEQAQRQAEQLGGYRGEYQQRWTTQFSSSGTDTALLHCYQSFGERLHQAVDQQQQVRAQAQAQYDRAREALLAQELRLAAVSKLIERRQTAVRQIEEKREQKRNDEAASHSAANGSWNHPGGALA